MTDDAYGPTLFRGRIVQALMRASHESPGVCMLCRKPIEDGACYLKLKTGPLYHVPGCWQTEAPATPKKLTRV